MSTQKKPKQTSFSRLEKQVQHDQIADHLRGGEFDEGTTKQVESFTRCGKGDIWKVCKCCGEAIHLPWACSIKWCPLCNWRITDTRRQSLEAWTRLIKQPKHMVLTQRNFETLTAEKLKEHRQNLSRIRRQEVMEWVKGGCVSVELTNKGEGWHLHSHWLIEARFIDAEKLAIAWGELVGQEFGIVKVKDCRAADMRREVAKYVCKGSEMARWPKDKLIEFVNAVRGQRFFFQFGSILKQRAQVKAWMEYIKPERRACEECGAKEFQMTSSVRAFLRYWKPQTTPHR